MVTCSETPQQHDFHHDRGSVAVVSRDKNILETAAPSCATQSGDVEQHPEVTTRQSSPAQRPAPSIQLSSVSCHPISDISYRDHRDHAPKRIRRPASPICSTGSCSPAPRTRCSSPSSSSSCCSPSCSSSTSCCPSCCSCPSGSSSRSCSCTCSCGASTTRLDGSGD